MNSLIEKDEKGRFIKGNSGGKGRPKGTAIRDLRAIARKALGPTKLNQLVENAAEAALNGDWRAREWLTKLLVDDKQQLVIMYDDGQAEREEYLARVMKGMTEDEKDSYEQLLGKTEEMQDKALARLEEIERTETGQEEVEEAA